ncbi:hypothetical protein ABMA28_010033 [Loxostege sticticalis]|uniref:Uncharacterized protein n=1 Tax=Loxostege sticticalis TaxID=481309 RepID=A0ABD0S9F9_LOXSC
MWWRFLTFLTLFFKRCCDDGIENDQVVFESFSNNYLKERLIAVDIVFDNGTFVPEDVDIREVIEDLREKLNVHDPNHREKIDQFEENFKGLEDFGEEMTDAKANTLEDDAINVVETNEIANKSDKIKTNASDKDLKSRDSETKDDVIELKTEKSNNDTIIVT